jgi:hypothetical protein
VKRAGFGCARTKRSEPRPHHTGRLVGERDREHLLRAERAGGDLPCDPPRDRRRLSRARTREDADGAAHHLRSAALREIQAVENVHAATVPARSVGAAATSLRISAKRAPTS